MNVTVYETAADSLRLTKNGCTQTRIKILRHQSYGFVECTLPIIVTRTTFERKQIIIRSKEDWVHGPIRIVSIEPRCRNDLRAVNVLVLVQVETEGCDTGWRLFECSIGPRCELTSDFDWRIDHGRLTYLTFSCAASSACQRLCHMLAPKHEARKRRAEAGPRQLLRGVRRHICMYIQAYIY